MKSRLILLTSLLLAGCTSIQKDCLEPDITYIPTERCVRVLSSPFPPLNWEERDASWANELTVGLVFAKELDYYRAITALKRAKILIPASNTERLGQIEYSLILCYYLAGKPKEALDQFEESSLTKLSTRFPALSTLLPILYDIYLEVGYTERAEQILELIEKFSPTTACKLKTGEAIKTADFETLFCQEKTECAEAVLTPFLSTYFKEKKSITKAEIYNAVLPGAGYWYVGQPTSAITSLLLNAAFIAATYQFFDHGYVAAGAFTLSLEFGWYIGGINGAGMAAKQYNDTLYNTMGRNAMVQGNLFPALMIEKGF